MFATDGSTQRHGLKIILEGNPKLDLLCDMLDEVEEAMKSSAIGAADMALFRAGVSSSGGSATSSQAASSSSEERSATPPGASVLVLTRDDRTCASLQQFVSVDQTGLVRQEFFRSVSAVPPVLLN